MFNKNLLGSTLMLALAITAPAFAQSQIDNNQPVQGTLRSREIDMQNKLNAAYSNGNISSTELASMQRDLDGILVKEDRQRTKAGGMSDSNCGSISKALDVFEGNLCGHKRKTAGASNSVVMPIGQAITGNQSSIINPSEKTYLVPTASTVGTPTTTTTTTIRSVAMPNGAVLVPVQ